MSSSFSAIIQSLNLELQTALKGEIFNQNWECLQEEHLDRSPPSHVAQFVDDIVQTRDSLSVSLKCLFAEYKVKLSSVLINTIFLRCAKYTEKYISNFSRQCLFRMGIEYPDYETWSLWTMKTKM